MWSCQEPVGPRPGPPAGRGGQAWQGAPGSIRMETRPPSSGEGSLWVPASLPLPSGVSDLRFCLEARGLPWGLVTRLLMSSGQVAKVSRRLPPLGGGFLVPTSVGVDSPAEGAR